MKIAVLVIGILGVLLGIIVSGISLALPEFTSNRVNFEEAMIGVVIGGLIFLFSLLIAIVGLVLVIKNRKKE
ncbi:MAG: hypothetical protein KDB79_13060 [Acidobacteria bacterium]|nr:hypothetical protein [Acidobacteriota bacterium]